MPLGIVIFLDILGYIVLGMATAGICVHDWDRNGTLTVGVFLIWPIVLAVLLCKWTLKALFGGLKVVYDIVRSK